MVHGPHGLWDQCYQADPGRCGADQRGGGRGRRFVGVPMAAGKMHRERAGAHRPEPGCVGPHLGLIQRQAAQLHRPRSLAQPRFSRPSLAIPRLRITSTTFPSPDLSRQAVADARLRPAPDAPSGFARRYRSSTTGPSRQSKHKLYFGFRDSGVYARAAQWPRQRVDPTASLTKLIPPRVEYGSPRTCVKLLLTLSGRLRIQK